MEAICNLGYSLHRLDFARQDYNYDSCLREKIEKELAANLFDCIFTFNYFPSISRVCETHGIKYISWVFDSPHMTLFSKTVKYQGNYIYVFDADLYKRMRKQGIETVYYSPLAVNSIRLEKQLLSCKKKPYQHDVCFVGKLYADEYNFYEQIAYLPEYCRGYLDAVIEAQKYLFGCDLVEELLDGKILEELGKYIQLDMGSEYYDIKNDFLKNMIKKKVTVEERHGLLEMLSERFAVDLYTTSETQDLCGVRNHGYCEYYTQMPEIFNRSKINLNITLRSITSGIPLRALDIMGAGGFLLSNYQPELAEYFKDGEDMVMFYDEKDLIDKTKYYLQNEEMREKIAKRGQEKVKEFFEYEKILSKILCQ